MQATAILATQLYIIGVRQGLGSHKCLQSWLGPRIGTLHSKHEKIKNGQGHYYSDLG